jgi:hypothetical protein
LDKIRKEAIIAYLGHHHGHITKESVANNGKTHSEQLVSELRFKIQTFRIRSRHDKPSSITFGISGVNLNMYNATIQNAHCLIRGFRKALLTQDGHACSCTFGNLTKI